MASTPSLKASSRAVSERRKRAAARAASDGGSRWDSGMTSTLREVSALRGLVG
ncbi:MULTISPECIES: hypothetical protein [Streptomyces]|uniref:Uncharacterized protein n=1 Tax=Streptomyces flaveolus TaxID=67297 RepID=A0ABV1VIJ2_9ACTN